MCAQIGCPHPNYLGTERWPLTSDEFTDWIARNEQKPFADEWQQTAVIASEVHNAGVILASLWGLKEDSQYTIAGRSEFTPAVQDTKGKRKKRKKGRRLSAREAEIEMRARCGF